MYFYQSKKALRLTLGATLTKFDRVMQLAAIARKYDLNLANDTDYEKAMFELIMEISRHQKFKLSFLQRSVCAIRHNSRLSGHVSTISENDLEYLADQIRNEPLFAKIYIRTPEEIQKHDLDVLPEYIKDIIISIRKSAEFLDVRSRSIPKLESVIEQNSEFDKKRDAVTPRNEPQSEDVSMYKKGDIIGRKYEVYSVLGEGGFGVIFLVYNRYTREARALKTFRDKFLVEPAAREAFKKEALLWVNLETHPYILAAEWVSNVSGRLFVEMDYIAPDDQGCVNLADHLVRAGAPMDTNQSLKWAIQFCLGMEHARAHGIECHRDIKPANIMITQDGTLKISDFGLAAAAEVAWRGLGGLGDSLVTGGEKNVFGFSLMQSDGKLRCGTPGYMAPEVYRCEGADIRSDIFSFGLVLWQMAAGSRVPPYSMPWRGDVESYLLGIYEQQMSGRVPRITQTLDSIIERCLQPCPSERYSNFQELRKALEPIWEERIGRKFDIPQIKEQTEAFWTNKGRALQVLLKHEDALNCYDKALAIDPRQFGAWTSKGNALRALNRNDDALSCYDKALAINPRYYIAWTAKSDMFQFLGRYEDAIGCCDKALALNDRTIKASVLTSKGNALRALNRNDDALSCYDKALAINPQESRAWNNKGDVLEGLGRHEEAIGCYDKVLAIDPQYLYAWNKKGDVLEELDQYEEAVGCYDKVLAIDPCYIGAWESKGNALLVLGRNEDALCCCDKALAIRPRNVTVWSTKGQAFYALGRSEDALNCFDKALAIGPGYYIAWALKGDVLQSLGRDEEALKCYDEALANDSEDVSVWFNKAISEDTMGHWREAINSYRKAIDLAPPEYESYISYARKRLQELESK